MADAVEVCWIPEDEQRLQDVVRVRDQAGGPTRTESTTDQCYRLEGLTADRTYAITVVARTTQATAFPKSGPRPPSTDRLCGLREPW